jgi:two-component system sensor histidine kinase KdpD
MVKHKARAGRLALFFSGETKWRAGGSFLAHGMLFYANLSMAITVEAREAVARPGRGGRACLDARLPQTRDSGFPAFDGNGRELRAGAGKSKAAQYFLAAGTVLAVTVVSYWAAPLIGARAAGLVFLLAVVVLGVFVGRGPNFLAAALSALVWDFFFLPPVFHFRVASFEDAMLCGMYFVVAAALGQLTARIQAEQEQACQREAAATALYQLARELGERDDIGQVLEVAARQTELAFGAPAAVLLSGGPKPDGMVSPSAGLIGFAGEEREAAVWAMEHGTPAGPFTGRFEASSTLFLPLWTGGGLAGALAIRERPAAALTGYHRGLLDAFAQQIALALDRQRLREASEKARFLAESEKLSKTLLNAMSHEIRTPVAAIKSAAGNLVEFRDRELSATQDAMVAEILEATERLDRLVVNALEAGRLESGRVKPKLVLCDALDLIIVAMKETRKQLSGHKVSFDAPRRPPLARLDFVLISQAVANLLANAAFHTPPGSEVKISARAEDGFLVIEVADSGPGLSPEVIPHVFEKFYRAPGARAGGTGLGLSVVKGLVDAHQGRVRAENRPEGGARFSIFLPLDGVAGPPTP